MLTFTVSRRQAWIVVLIVLTGAIWLVREDRARAGAEVPQGDGIDVVYLAVATNFPDSIAVGPGAGVNAAPILLVPTDPPIPGFIEAELMRLDPQKVVIVGGTAAISNAMQAAVEALLPSATVERLAGSNRYETNTLFTQSVYPVEAWASIHSSEFLPTAGGAVTLGLGSAHGNGGDMLAPIQLPHGATILEFRVEGEDTNGVIDAEMFLVRQCAADFISIMALFSSGSGGFFDVSTTHVDLPEDRVVDNENCAYTVAVASSDTDVVLYGARVKYRLGTPGA